MTDERALNAAIETVRNRNIATLELAIKVGIEAYLAALAHPAPATVESAKPPRRDDPFRPAVDVDADDDYYPSREED